MLNEHPESFAKFVFAGDTNIQVDLCKKCKKNIKKYYCGKPCLPLRTTSWMASRRWRWRSSSCTSETNSISF